MDETHPSTTPVRVRFAPSPTGPLHIGGLRTALYNYLFAAKHGGTFILRIEDTDAKRFVAPAEKYITDALEWAGIIPQESPLAGGEYGPYRQSERKQSYKQYSDLLIEKGYAYYAFDSAEELEDERQKASKAGIASWQYNSITRQRLRNSLALPANEVQTLLDQGHPYVVRIKWERNQEIKFEDKIRGWVSTQSHHLDDKVIFKSDGMPTYHLANVVDDHLMKITHVIRGEEWLPSTPLHYYLYQCFGWDAPAFAHLPLILKPEGKGKLSKRDGDRLGIPVFPLDWADPSTDQLSEGFRERGFLPEATLNFLALLGWNPGGNEEIFDLKELEEAFSLERVGKSGAKFDFEKARWINQRHLSQKSSEEIAPMLKENLTTNGIAIPSDTTLIKIIESMKERAHITPELYTEGAYFYHPPREFDQKLIKKKWNESGKALLREYKEKLSELSNEFTEKEIDECFDAFLTDKGLSFGQFGPVLRLSLTGVGKGTPLGRVCHILGKEETVQRIADALENIPIS